MGWLGNAMAEAPTTPRAKGETIRGSFEVSMDTTPSLVEGSAIVRCGEEGRLQGEIPGLH